MDNYSNITVSRPRSRKNNNLHISVYFQKGFRIILKGILLCLFIVPSLAFAASHTYSCSDLNFTGNGGSCTDPGTANFVDSAYVADHYSTPATAGFDLISSSTWYLTLTSTGSSGYVNTFIHGDNADCPATQITTSGTYTLVGCDGNTHEGLAMANSVGLTGSFSNICIDDDRTSCGEPPMPTDTGSPMATTSQYTQFYGTIGMFTMLMIGLLQLFFILIVLWIMIIVFGWPIKMFWKVVKGLLGMGFYDGK